MNEFEQAACIDKLHGWELIDFLEVSIEDVLVFCLDSGHINDDNITELLQYIGVTE